MAYESLDTAEADSVLRDLQAAQELEGAGLAAVNLQRQQRAGVVGLRVSNLYLRGVGEQRRIDDAFDARMFGQLLGDSLCVLALPIHPQRDGRQARIEHPAFVSLQDV